MYAVLSTDTQKHNKYHLVTVKPSFTVKPIDCLHQTGHTGTKMERLGMSSTCTTITMSVSVSLALSTVGVILHQSWYKNQWVPYYLLLLRYEACHWWHFFFLSAKHCTDAYCIQQSPTAAVQNAHFPFFLGYGHGPRNDFVVVGRGIMTNTKYISIQHIHSTRGYRAEPRQTNDISAIVWEWLGVNRPPIGRDHLLFQWSRDRWRRVTLGVKLVTQFTNRGLSAKRVEQWDRYHVPQNVFLVWSYDWPFWYNTGVRRTDTGRRLTPR